MGVGSLKLALENGSVVDGNEALIIRTYTQIPDRFEESVVVLACQLGPLVLILVLALV